jgi:cobalamin biosynthesis Mg chelatase CobN
MAAIVAQAGRMSFKLDTGEMRDGKAVYRTISLAGVKGDAEADDLAPVADEIESVVGLSAEQVSLQRTEILER